MTRRAQNGFSLIELLIVVTIILIVAAMAMLGFNSTLQNNNVNSAYTTTLTTLWKARQAAVSQRQIYVVTFAAGPPSTITVAPNYTSVSATNVLNITATLPTGTSFDAESGLPSTANTVPDGFGSGASSGAIYFYSSGYPSGTPIIYFWPDGSVRDSNGTWENNFIDGLVYIAQPGNLASSYAVSVWGTTGRVRGWRLLNNAWVQQ